LKKEFSELPAVAVDAGEAIIAGAAFLCPRPITGKVRIDVISSKILILAV
jgi:hypothetical protein